MVARVSQRLAEGQSGPVFYPRAAIVGGLNEGLRFFTLLTLGLEQVAEWTVTPATTWFHMLDLLPDWICPLRITTQSGAKVRPARMDELTALDPGWISSAAAADQPPTRYAALGADLLALYKQPPGAGIVLNVTYARSPVTMVSDTDIPEMPAEYHSHLVDYGVYTARQPEGAQEFEKVLPNLDSFLNAATRYAAYVRARNRGSQYDKTPFELEKFDRSTLLKLRKDLMPARAKESN